MGKRITKFTSLSADITKPFPTKEMDLTVQMLTLMTGTNGTGKTFWMIHFYFFGQVAQLIVSGVRGEALLQSAQFMLDNCLKDPDTSGSIKANFDGGPSIEIDMEDGKIRSIIFKEWEDVEYVAPVKYMSTAMRTFDAIKIYLRTRSLIKRLSDDQEFFYTEILKSYRLYDVTYMEGLLLKMPLKVDGVMKEYLEKFDVKEKITDFGVDFEEEDFYLKYEGDEKKKYLTTFGAGHQSIFNMVMGNV
jgi:hypothetical protein